MPFLNFCLLCIFISMTFAQKYFAINQQMTWHQAHNACTQRGTSLASIHSADDMKDAISICSTHTSTYLSSTISGCWLGLHIIDQANGWIWTDGSSVDYGFYNNDATRPTTSIYPWGNSEPNNMNYAEDCGELWLQNPSIWNDHSCDKLNYVICNQINTNMPTQTPTFNPTADPTHNPTDMPSHMPTWMPTEVYLTTQLSTTNEYVSTETSFSIISSTSAYILTELSFDSIEYNNNIGWIIGMSVGIFLICAMGVMIVYLLYERKRHQQMIENMMLNQVQLDQLHGQNNEEFEENRHDVIKRDIERKILDVMVVEMSHTHTEHREGLRMTHEGPRLSHYTTSTPKSPSDRCRSPRTTVFKSAFPKMSLNMTHVSAGSAKPSSPKSNLLGSSLQSSSGMEAYPKMVDSKSWTKPTTTGRHSTHIEVSNAKRKTKTKQTLLI